MRGPNRNRLIPLALAAALVAAAGCGGDQVPVPGREGVTKSLASVRAVRRAYDGAPPTIPHASFGMRCEACHNAAGQSVTGVGFAPASPHVDTERAGGTTRCRQCHVFVTTDDMFVTSRFEAVKQDYLLTGGRATPGAPPTIPHRILMRENCVACHDGPGAREEVRTSHPERWRCRQCHVPVTVGDGFESALEGVAPGTNEGLEQ
jgi:cytochrome c-type protein NapB